MQVIQRLLDHANDTLREIEEYYRDYVIYKDSDSKAANFLLN
jgi:hypothetical protein